MAAALSGLGGVHPGGMVEVAKAAAADGAAMLIGIGYEAKLKAIISSFLRAFDPDNHR